MIDNTRARAITQEIADKLAACDAIDEDTITVGAKRVKRTRKRGKAKTGAVSGWKKNPGYQFTAQFEVNGIKISDGFFLPLTAEDDAYSLDSIVGYLTDGMTL